MQALKVTFKFAAPVFRESDHPIHLDALVAHSLMTELEDSGSDDPWKESSDLSPIFERANGLEGQWVWKASMLSFKPALPKQWVNQIRKCDPQAYYDDLGVYWQGREENHPLGIREETFSINTGSGHFRGYQWLVPTQWMESAHAWAVADKDALEHYLSRINHIGKKGVNGYGRISGFVVEDSPADESDNWALRVLADGVTRKPGVQYQPVMACLRAPYWKKLDRVMAFEPVF